MGSQLGRYSLEKKIGTGGMADVWLAHGPQGVCVVKCPHQHLCNNPDFLRMFLDEASLLAQLHHPGIAELYDLGEVNGVYYLAMEYVPGFDLMSISLEQERNGELMAPELVARIVADAAAALHYAHEATGQNGAPLNIIHRDVTPHNILLSRKGVVKLIDFGVAKASTMMHRTQAGLVKGKYPYMSPEQITGQVIDRRVDVYALGLVLYELLTNVRAIPGNTEVEQIDAARAGRIRPIEQLRPNVPVPLRQILGGCLHPEVEGRYPTALAVKEDLEKYLALEGHVVGQDDLLRLLRVVAADLGDLSFSARPTEEEQPAPDPGIVVVPSSTLPANKLDEVGFSTTLPSLQQSAPTDDVPQNAGGPQPSLTRHMDRSVSSAPPRSKAAMVALAGLSVLIIALVFALWQDDAPPVVTPATVEVDSGLAVVEPSALADASVAEEMAEVPDASAEVRAARVQVSSPSAATVTVDGKGYGATPLDLELTPGSHTIVVRNDGDGSERKVTWNLLPGETRTLSMARQKKVMLNVDAPPFCSLSIDGKKIAGPPVSVWHVEVTPGRHLVQCTLEDPSLPKPRVKSQRVNVSGDEFAVEFNMATD